MTCRRLLTVLEAWRDRHAPTRRWLLREALWRVIVWLRRLERP